MEFNHSFKTKIVSLLLVVIFFLSLVSLLVYMQVDKIVNVDLYSYGLQFNGEWALKYWLRIDVLIASLGSAIVMVAVALAIQYACRQGESRFLRWIRTLLPLCGAGLIVLSVSVILSIDWLVNSTLYQYGLQLDSAWAEQYWMVARVPLALMAIAVPTYCCFNYDMGSYWNSRYQR